MLPLSWIYSMVLMKRYIFVHKRLANITMNQKCIEHITLYSLVLVGTLVVGVLVRQYVLSKGVDDFSSSVAFFGNSNCLDGNLCRFTDNFQSVSAATHRSFSIAFLCFSNDEKFTMIPFLFLKPLQSKIQTKLRLISLSQILPLKKQSLNPQNMKLCEPTL